MSNTTETKVDLMKRLKTIIEKQQAIPKEPNWFKTATREALEQYFDDSNSEAGK